MNPAFDPQRAFGEACDLVYPLIEIHGRPAASLDAAASKSLRRGMELLQQVLQFDSAHWPTMWLLGKCHQRLGDNNSALNYFARAHELNPDQPDVAREASIAAMEIERPGEAVRFCERAIQANPEDAGLTANLALALLFVGEAERAERVANEALARNPTDEITSRIARVCHEVRTGRRACPRHVRDLS